MSRSSQMITFTLQNGVVATLRTSGTEPKIKYYTEFCAAPGKRSADLDTLFTVDLAFSLLLCYNSKLCNTGPLEVTVGSSGSVSLEG